MDSQGRLIIIPKENLICPTPPSTEKENLADRLGQVACKQWDLVFDEQKHLIYLWPQLKAEGKYRDGPIWTRNSPVLNLTADELIEKLLKRGYTPTDRGTDPTKGEGSYRNKHINIHIDPRKRGEPAHIDVTYDPGYIKKRTDQLNELRESAKKKGDKTAENAIDKELAFYNKPREQTRYRFMLKDPDDNSSPSPASQKPNIAGRDKQTVASLLTKLAQEALASHSLRFASFKETIQQNQLSETYNASHPEKPISARSGGGSIGGVGSQVGIIKDLFKTYDDLENDHHYFFIPSPDGKMPFTNDELQQILRELAVGIYVYDTVPFFSLHFNVDHLMYPVIHPCYQHTLIGRIISLLDYYMKGFLNGAFFEESFLKEWQSKKPTEEKFLKSKCIDLHAYCQEHLGSDCEYRSVRELLQKMDQGIFSKIFNVLSGKDDPPIFSDYSGFRSSFRIIAKQNSIKKNENLFLLDADFDVLYTVDPDPVYEDALKRYRYQHGVDPAGYTRLITAYDAMCYQIKTLMPRLPLFRDLFEQLKVINFFSYYFKTLKKSQRIPYLEQRKESPSFSCQPLFPYLPVRRIKSEKVTIHIGKVFDSMPPEELEKVHHHLQRASEEDPPEWLVKLIAPYFRKQIQDQVSFPLSDEQPAMEQHKKMIGEYVKALPAQAKQVIESAKHELKELKEAKDLLELAIPLYDKYNFPEKYLELHKQLNALQKMISMIEGGPIDYLACSQNLAFTFSESRSFIQFHSEQPEEEKEQNKRIVGGCGLQLSTLPLSVAPMGESILNQAFPSLMHLADEQMHPVHLNQQPAADGYVFRLHFARFDSTSNKDYGWMHALLSSEETRNWEPKSRLFAAIERNEIAEFKDALSQWVEDEDLQNRKGMHLFHFAAMAPSSQFLQALLQKQEELVQYAHDLHTAVKAWDHSQLRLLQYRNPQMFSYLERNGAMLHYLKVPRSIYSLMPSLPEFLEKLLQKLGALVRDEYGYLPLHAAAQAGNLENVKLLLRQHPETLHHRAHNGATPLYMAVQHGHLELVRYFIRKGASLNLATTHGMTPLICALHHGHEAIAAELLKNPSTQVNTNMDDGSTPLLVALEGDLLESVRLLLEKGASVHAARRDTYTALHLAAKLDRFEICDLLISRQDINLNVQLKSGRTPLHLAAEEGHLEIVILLLMNQADASLTGWDQETAFLTAIASGNGECAENIFLHTPEEKRSPLFSPNIKGETPLSVAISNQLWEVFEMLLDLGHALPPPAEYIKLLCVGLADPRYIHDYIKKHSIPRKELEAACRVAAQHGHTQMVEIFQVVFGFNEVAPDEQGWRLIHYGAKYNHINVVNRFLSSSPKDLVQLTKDGKSIAAIACENGSLKILKPLLQAMIKQEASLQQNYKGCHLLMAAVENDQREAIDMILHEVFDVNIPVDNEGNTAAHIMAKRGDTEMLLYLRSRDADFSLRNCDGKTPIHYAYAFQWEDSIDFFLRPYYRNLLPDDLLFAAAAEGSAVQIDALVRRGLKTSTVNRDQENPLFEAIRHGNEAAFLSLCQHGADLDQRSTKGLTPLLLAARSGQLEILNFLLSRVRLDQTTPQGRTALHLAVESGHEECVQMLLRNGFDSKAADKDQVTPCQIAKQKGSRHIQTLLLGKGSELQRSKEELVKALKRGDEETAFNLMQLFPLNQSVAFELDGKRQQIPLLHLIHIAVSDSQLKERMIHRYKKIKGVDPQVCSPDGKTLYHLMALTGEPFEMSREDLLRQDSQGLSVLHYACMSKLLMPCLSKWIKSISKSIDIEDQKGMTPLFAAVVAQAPENVRLLLEAKANPNHRAADGSTPMILAIELGHALIVQLLLDHGADIDLAASRNKITPLLQAIYHENMPLVHLLINRRANIQKGNQQGITPLHLTAQKGNMALLRLLHARGASLDAKDRDGRTIVHYAALSKNPKVIDFLVELGISVNQATEVKEDPLREMHEGKSVQGIVPIHLAAQTGSLDMVIKLIHTGSRVTELDSNELGLLAYAARSGNKKLMQYFKDFRILREDKHQMQAILAAIAHDNPTHLKILYAVSKDLIHYYLPETGESQLHLCAIFGSMRCASFLMAKGANPTQLNFQGESPLDLAIEHQSHDVAFYLLQQEGVELNEKTNHLHQACERGDQEMVALLITYGADLNQFNYQCWTPLHIAALKKNYLLMHLLLAAGADASRLASDKEWLQETGLDRDPTVQHLLKTYAVKEDGFLLQNAIKRQDHLHLSFLLNSEDVNHQDKQGRTPLHEAVLHRDLTVIRQLLEKGADLNIQDHQNRTPLYLAAFIVQDLKIVDFLVRAKADLAPPGNEPLLWLVTQLKDSDYAHRLFDAVLPHLNKDSLQPEGLRMNKILKKKDVKDLLFQISKGYPLENKTLPLVVMAAMQNSLSCMTMLVEWCRLNPNSQDEVGMTPLHWAALQQDPSLTQYLLSQKAQTEIREKGSSNTPLGIASLNFHIENVRLLLNAKSNPNVILKNGNSLLYEVTQSNHEQARPIFNLLFSSIPAHQQEAPSSEMIAAINKQDKKIFFLEIQKGHPIETASFSLLTLAAMHSNAAFTEFLFQWLPFSINHVDAEGRSPLHGAAKSGLRAFVQTLVEKGALLEQKDVLLRTPLYWAAISGNLQTTTYLLEAHAEPVLEDKKGETLLQAISKSNSVHAGKILDLIYQKIPKQDIVQIDDEMLKILKQDDLHAFFCCLNKGYPIINKGFSLAEEAAVHNALTITQFLLTWFLKDVDIRKTYDRMTSNTPTSRFILSVLVEEREATFSESASNFFNWVLS